MSKDEILVRLQDIFRDVFDDEDLEVDTGTNSETVEEWDSLNHINLVSSIEKEFDIKFTLNELIGLKDVGEMIDLMIEKKINE